MGGTGGFLGPNVYTRIFGGPGWTEDSTNVAYIEVDTQRHTETWTETEMDADSEAENI